MVFHKDLHTDHDEDNRPGDLHSVTEEILKLFTENDTGKRDRTTDKTSDECRYQDDSPEYFEPDTDSKGIATGSKGEHFSKG